MAGVRISALPPVGASLLTDLIPAVQAGVTSRETLQQVVTLFNSNIQLSNINQVTGLPAALAGFLPLTGGTLTGPLILNTNSPTIALEAASKGYVDTVAAGFTVILAVEAATTVNLTATQAGAGVGATLTNAGAMVALVVDGFVTSVNDRILVKDQTLTQHNGIYIVTDIGSGATNWVLTRATDYDQPSEIFPGTLIAVNNGTVNGTTSWLETATVVTVDTDPVLFSQFTFSPTAFLMAANNLSDLTNIATARTNLGLGTAATKNASDNLQSIVASVNGATVIGNLAVFSDINGTIANSSIGSTTTGSGSIVLQNSPSLLTPNLGVATATSLAFSPTTNGIIGTTTNDNAIAGVVGEYSSSVILSGAAVILTSSVGVNITSILLSPGDYDVWGEVWTTGNNTAVIQNILCSINTTSATIASTPGNGTSTISSGTVSYTIGTQILPTFDVGPCRISIAGPTTVFLVANYIFTTAQVRAYGKLCARRIR